MALEARSALVTGGAKGIGAAIARRLAAEGARVTIGDVDTEGADQVASEIGATAVPLDVTDPDSARTAVEGTGGLDVLVNNAGMDEFAFFTDTDPGLWDRVIAVNLKGVLACTHAVLPGMQKAGYGRIVKPLLRRARELGEIGERIIETMKEATQLRRLGRPEEVAGAVAFLASEEAAYVTGETLGVSGGLGVVGCWGRGSGGGTSLRSR